MPLILALALARTAHGAAPARSWLDVRPLVNWNEPGASIPRGPTPLDPSQLRDCARRAPGKAQPPSRETRQVSAAGWLNARVSRRVSDAAFVLAWNGADGMCRPRAFQYFVFLGGRFAGTVSPRPMDSREDGSAFLGEVHARRFTARYMRYDANDPLCCPSRETSVSFELRPAAGGAFVAVPVQAHTEPTSR